jgi:hypothetical protein
MKNIGDKVEDFFVHILIMVSGALALVGIGWNQRLEYF